MGVTGSGLLLRSLNGETRWIPGEWVTARCSIGDHGAPQEGCTCGFYAAKGLDEVLAIAGYRLAFVRLWKEVDGSGAVDGAAAAVVIGRVRLAGKVIEHARGYRAERARIVEILPLSGEGQRAALEAERYGVPLGEEVPAPQFPDVDSRVVSGVIGCSWPGPTEPTEPTEPTVIGRLGILLFSLLLVAAAVGGITEHHGLDWSDWFPCLIVIGGMLGIWRAVATLPRAMRGLSFTVQGHPRPLWMADRPSYPTGPAPTEEFLVTGDSFVPGRPDPHEFERRDGVRVPDAIEPITAFRVWRVDEAVQLRSFASDTWWSPGQWLIARCERTQHQAPREGCTCGLYSAKDIDTILSLVSLLMLAESGDLSDQLVIVGRVELAGKVIEHDHGYRAERARIVELLPMAGWGPGTETVARRYGVPVGQEIEVPPLPDIDLPGSSVATVCRRPLTELEEPTVIGRLWILAASLPFAIMGLQGLSWEPNGLGFDWWLCLIGIGGVLGILWSLATLPRAVCLWSRSMQGPPAVPDQPRPH